MNERNASLVPHEYMQTISTKSKIPDTNRLDLLRTVVNLYTLADLIGVETQFLTKVLYRYPYRNHYHNFYIEKKNGEKRSISAPKKELKEIQFKLAQLFYDCRKTIAETEKSVGASSYGFEKNKGTYENAKKHLNRRFVLNFDLKDFFPSIHLGRIKGVLIKDRNFRLDQKIAQVIAQICCENGRLPQGSPLSPVISNLVAEILDRRLRKFCNLHRCSYTRYVDDITISTNLRKFPEHVANVNQRSGLWELSNPLIKLVNKTGYEINHTKTRMQYSSQRQVVTGLTVNSVPMPVREFRYKTRAMCNSLFSTGKYSINENVFDVSNDVKEIRPLKGRILYQANISNRSFDGKSGEITSGEKTLKKFIYFELFALGEKPLIITEGITDRIYLKHALKFRKLLPPELLNISGVKFDIYNPTQFRKNKLKLGDGAQQIKEFIFRYCENKEKYKFYPRNKPIICILDNDREGRGVFKALRSEFNTNEISNSIIHIVDEVYVVILNHEGDDKEIENYFSDNLLAKKIGNRSFELINEKSPETYDKGEFAKYVVQRFSMEADFIKFEQIFSDIAMCVSVNNRRLMHNFK